MYYVGLYPGAGGLPLANTGAVTTQNSRKRVSVYADENTVPSLLPEQNEEYISVPLPEVIDRENQLQPGRWNDTRVSIVIVLLCYRAVKFSVYL